MINPFVLDPKEYKRNVDPIKQAIDQYATYLSKKTGKDYAKCREFVVAQFQKGGKFEFHNPEVLYLERNEFGDREKKIGTLRDFIYDSINKQQLISPSLNTYIPPEQRQSYLGKFAKKNIALRNAAKAEKFKYTMAGDKTKATFKNNEQNNRKVKNNSISGGHVSPSTPLHNPTAHTTLTSNCRCTSGYGNANNEKFISGNRHYWSPEIIRANIASIITHVDYDKIAEVMVKYKLYYPTTDDVMRCIEYSSNMYFRNKREMDNIRDFVDRLNELEKAAFVYVGDLYHLRELNHDFVYHFIDEFSNSSVSCTEDPKVLLKSVRDDNVVLAKNLHNTMCKGKRDSDLTEDELRLLAGTARNVGEVGDKYSDLIRTFWVTPNVPASLARFPESVRKTALTSDTDSTIFTVQDWVKWHQGSYGFTDKCIGVASTIVYFAAQTITHTLAIMSSNYGVGVENLFRIAMKNEFRFDVFVPTQAAKHYFALIGCQEGNVFDEYKEEIKGAQLRSSNIPVEITKGAKSLMREIMDTVLKEEEIDLDAILKRIGDVERNILASIKQGDFKYFRRIEVKEFESYKKKEEDNTFLSYELWQTAFAPKYGDTPPPPYTGLKISAVTDKSRAMQDWLDSMSDRELSERISSWLVKHDKKQLGTFIIPQTIAASVGIPDELLDALGIRNLTRELCGCYYLILETLGVYFDSGHNTKLVSDYY